MPNNHISKSTFKFLKDLQANNNRDWFAKNKDRYLEANDEMKALNEALLNKMSYHDEIERIKLYRIYRDIRFSKDKTPYKGSLSTSMKRATKWLRGGYFFKIEPGNSFAAGGFWGPNSADLKRIRQEIAANDKPFRKILKSAAFKKTFGSLEGEQVKSAPRGFDKNHPAIDLLRYKQFIVYRQFTDKEVLAPGFVNDLSKSFKSMRPFFNYMSEVLTTDENGVPLK